MAIKLLKEHIFFTKTLLDWNEKSNSREMPWKYEKDPYKIWLSEIILQQTRVEQGWDYYNRFVKKFPTVQKLASAKEAEVFKLWEGLGYYNRCKNLITTAKNIAQDLDGIFPNTYEGLLSLKGIGPYTAAAIASFAYNLPHAVVDGNVTRVLSRFFGIPTPIDSSSGKKEFPVLAQTLLDKKFPGIYNQSIMDFGATICKPKLPLCKNCMMSKNCVAFQENKVNELPVKSKSIIVKERWFYYLVASYKDKTYIRKRVQQDIWQNLYEFILIEEDSFHFVEDIIKSNKYKAIVSSKAELIKCSALCKQKLTHQTIHCIFIHLKLHQPLSMEGLELKDDKGMKKIAFPRLITNYFKVEIL